MSNKICMLQVSDGEDPKLLSKIITILPTSIIRIVNLLSQPPTVCDEVLAPDAIWHHSSQNILSHLGKCPNFYFKNGQSSFQVFVTVWKVMEATRPLAIALSRLIRIRSTLMAIIHFLIEIFYPVIGILTEDICPKEGQTWLADRWGRGVCSSAKERVWIYYIH